MIAKTPEPHPTSSTRASGRSPTAATRCASASRVVGWSPSPNDASGSTYTGVMSEGTGGSSQAGMIMTELPIDTGRAWSRHVSAGSASSVSTLHVQPARRADTACFTATSPSATAVHSSTSEEEAALARSSTAHTPRAHRASAASSDSPAGAVTTKERISRCGADLNGRARRGRHRPGRCRGSPPGGHGPA